MYLQIEHSILISSHLVMLLKRVSFFPNRILDPNTFLESNVFANEKKIKGPAEGLSVWNVCLL